MDSPPFAKTIEYCKHLQPAGAVCVEEVLSAACLFVDARRVAHKEEDYGEGYRLGRATLRACILVLTDTPAAAFNPSRLVRTCVVDDREDTHVRLPE